MLEGACLVRSSLRQIFVSNGQSLSEVLRHMQINISGKNMDTGMAFQEHAVTSLNAIVEKYCQNAVSGHVTLEKADSGFTVKTRVALSRRMELEATGRAANAHAALDAAIEHAEKRLRRHKRRLKNHRSTLTSSEETMLMQRLC